MLIREHPRRPWNFPTVDVPNRMPSSRIARKADERGRVKGPAKSPLVGYHIDVRVLVDQSNSASVSAEASRFIYCLDLPGAVCGIDRHRIEMRGDSARDAKAISRQRRNQEASAESEIPSVWPWRDDSRNQRERERAGKAEKERHHNAMRPSDMSRHGSSEGCGNAAWMRIESLGRIRADSRIATCPESTESRPSVPAAYGGSSPYTASDAVRSSC